jgi:hypothetical protein
VFKGKITELIYIRCEVYMAVTVKNVVSWDVTLCGSSETDISEDRVVSIITVKRMSGVGREQ